MPLAILAWKIKVKRSLISSCRQLKKVSEDAWLLAEKLRLEIARKGFDSLRHKIFPLF
jgi:hypothetical protein